MCIIYFTNNISMSKSYIIYPEAMDKLDNAWIIKKIKEIKKSDKWCHYHEWYVSNSEVVNTIKQLQEEKFYKHYPKDLYLIFTSKLQDIFSSLYEDEESKTNKNRRIIEKDVWVQKVLCKYSHLHLFSGWWASEVIKAKDIENYKKRWFHTPHELLAVSWVYLLNSSSHDSEKWYSWKWKNVFQKEITNIISWSVHWDLRIFQKDNHPYSTKDPLWFDINMRPNVKDTEWLYGYHSEEWSLLTTVMKYAEQKKIDTWYKKEYLQKYINWWKQLRSDNISIAEWMWDSYSGRFYLKFLSDIPNIKKDEKLEHSQYIINLEHEWFYRAYIAENWDLVFIHNNAGKTNISARFTPDDIPHLIKWLIHQSIHNLGRTSPHQIFSILEYRHSSEFDKFVLEKD